MNFENQFISGDVIKLSNVTAYFVSVDSLFLHRMSSKFLLRT